MFDLLVPHHKENAAMPLPESITLLVPVYNEEENLPVLYGECVEAMAGVQSQWELLLVDDGSSDASLQVLKDLAAKDQRVCYVSFAKNCGQSAAFAAGFQMARGEVSVTMDADLQNDPADIPAMLELYGQGYDMVIGWRANRQDSLAKKWASKFANAVRNKVSKETVKDTGCSLKVMRTDMARKLPVFTGMHRFFPTLMKMHGASVAEVKVNHRPRLHGKSKYGVLDRALTTWYDLIAVRWMQLRFIRYDIKEHN